MDRETNTVSATTSPSPTSTIPPLPDHWKSVYWTKGIFPLNALEALIFYFLALNSSGRPNLKVIWELVQPAHQDRFIARREQLALQIQNTSVVSGLILATTAVYLTTTPPREKLIPYTEIGPYILILISSAMSMSAVLYGGGLQQVIAHASQAWFRETLCGSRSCILITMCLISLPNVQLATSGVFCALGLFAAALLSDKPAVATGGIIIIGQFVVVGGLALWAALLAPTKRVVGSAISHRDKV